MKRSSLLQHLRRHGCYLKREGRAHSLWCNPQTGAVEAVPRHMQRLEEELVRPDVRRSPEKMAALLADDFVEFGSSGRRYGKADLLDTAAQPEEGRRSLQEFAPHALAPSIALVTYRSIVHHNDGSTGYAWRSSIWRRTAHGWQLVFHQGTPTPPAP